jgi:hypothetical protein
MAMPAHLTLHAEKQGNIEGSCDMQGREKTITGRSIAGGVTMADVLSTANHYNLNRPWLLTSMTCARQ